MLPASGNPRNSLFLYFLRLALFWMMLFIGFRIIFLCFYAGKAMGAGGLEIFQGFIAGFRLDLSTMAYLMLPSFVLWVAFQFSHARVVQWVHQGYHALLFFGFSVLYVCTIKMYHEWQMLLSVGVFDYLANPEEVTSFISTGQLILIVMAIVVVFVSMLWLFKKMVGGLIHTPKNRIRKALLVLLLPILLGIAARGGFQLIPINESSAYYSDKPLLNHAAINPIWYFIHSMLEKDADNNPYQLMAQEDAALRAKSLFAVTDTNSIEILTTSSPNLVFILLESWTADIIEALDGERGITPHFDSLRREGLLFSQIYAAGGRTEHGLVSVLSGYPPPPKVSIITIPHKATRISNINTAFALKGYHSSFYYGGEIGFVNMKGYLLNAGFLKIVDKNNFAGTQMNSKWGAHDEFVFNKQLEDLQQTPPPFLSVVLTLSTHEPFEVPMETPFNGHHEPDKFRKAAYYTDHCLGEYFKKAKQQSWYSNTLFILVADHGHRLPRETDINRPESKRVPLLLFGEVLKPEYRGIILHQVGSQHDIPATLLPQLGMTASAFSNSKNLLQPGAKQFAYYITDYVMGWVTPEESFMYVLETKEAYPADKTKEQNVVSDSLLLDAKAFLQAHYQQFLDF